MTTVVRTVATMPVKADDGVVTVGSYEGATAVVLLPQSLDARVVQRGPFCWIHPRIWDYPLGDRCRPKLRRHGLHLEADGLA
jgi:hypothetical protein